MSGKSKRPLLFWNLLLFAGFCLLASCQKPVLVLPPSQSSKFGVYLTDSQGSYQAVELNIQQVFIYVANDASAQSGWIEIPMTRPGIYNIASFQNGMDTLIAQSNVPPGIISQIRLMLGNNNSFILSDGLTVPLQIPSSLTAGIQLNLQDTLHAGIPFSLDIDINTASSIVGPDPQGQYFFQPAVTMFSRGSRNEILKSPDGNNKVIFTTNTGIISRN